MGIEGRVSFQRCLFVIILLILNLNVRCLLLVAEDWKMGKTEELRALQTLCDSYKHG